MNRSPETEKFVADVQALCLRYRVPHMAAEIAVNAKSLEDAQERILTEQRKMIDDLLTAQRREENIGRVLPPIA